MMTWTPMLQDVPLVPEGFNHTLIESPRVPCLSSIKGGGGEVALRRLLVPFPYHVGGCISLPYLSHICARGTAREA